MDRRDAVTIILTRTLKAGPTYLPPDPTHPPSLRQLTVRHPQSACVITRSGSKMRSHLSPQRSIRTGTTKRSLIDPLQSAAVAAQARRVGASDTYQGASLGFVTGLDRARERAERQSHG
jgi:hypothetical protein